MKIFYPLTALFALALTTAVYADNSTKDVFNDLAHQAKDSPSVIIPCPKGAAQCKVFPKATSSKKAAAKKTVSEPLPVGMTPSPPTTDFVPKSTTKKPAKLKKQHLRTK